VLKAFREQGGESNHLWLLHRVMRWCKDLERNRCQDNNYLKITPPLNHMNPSTSKRPATNFTCKRRRTPWSNPRTWSFFFLSFFAELPDVGGHRRESSVSWPSPSMDRKFDRDGRGWWKILRARGGSKRARREQEKWCLLPATEVKWFLLALWQRVVNHCNCPPFSLYPFPSLSSL